MKLKLCQIFIIPPVTSLSNLFNLGNTLHTYFQFPHFSAQPTFHSIILNVTRTLKLQKKKLTATLKLVDAAQLRIAFLMVLDVGYGTVTVVIFHPGSSS